MGQSVLISGATGLVGTAVSDSLANDGWRVARLVRRTSGKDNEVLWDPTKPLDPQSVSGFDTVVHLAGEPVFGVWNKAKMRRIRESRVLGTQTLSNALAACAEKPKVMVCASAVGYYGDREAEELTEDSPPGTGFLPATCVEWEAAAQPAKDAGIRVVHLRTGIVLSKHGGALKTMLPAFKLGIGGRLGSGEQYFPWLTLHDMVGIVRFAISRNGLAGAINAVAPEAVTNAKFTEDLADAVHRPAMIPVPAFVLKMLPGNMANEALLASARVVPSELQAAGFQFVHPRLKQALKSVMEEKE